MNIFLFALAILLHEYGQGKMKVKLTRFSWKTLRFQHVNSRTVLHPVKTTLRHSLCEDVTEQTAVSSINKISRLNIYSIDMRRKCGGYLLCLVGRKLQLFYFVFISHSVPRYCMWAVANDVGHSFNI